MEFQLPSFPILFHFPSLPVVFAFFISVLIVLKLAKRSKYTKQSSPKLPPGPRKLPVIGNLHQIVGSLPHHCLRDLAEKHGPLMHLQLGELSVVVVSSAEMAKEVMNTHDINFASRPYLLSVDIISYNSKSVGFSPYGDYWRQLRKICTMELLNTKSVRSFRSIREEEVANVIKSISISEGSPINLSEILYSLTNTITLRAALGRKKEDQGTLKLLLKGLVDAAGGFEVGDLFPSIKILPTLTGQKAKLERIHGELDRILDGIVDEHKDRREAKKKNGEGKGSEDLLDVLLRVQENGELEFPFTTENVKAVIVDIFSAGGDSSTVTVVWAMSELLKNQRLMEKAQAEVRRVCKTKGNVDETDLDELKYLKLVIKETLRLHPPGPLLLPRECREKCEIKGYEIPLKTKVMVNAWAIGRNPEYWIDAESFAPERFVDSSIDYKGTHFEYIPFGAGRRICPGISFGLANIDLILAQLLFHFDWKLANGTKNEDLDMTEVFGIVTRRKRDLSLIATTRHPLRSE